MSGEAGTITRDEVRRRLGDPSFVLLDVLPRVSYAEHHIPGALNLPVAEVQARAAELVPDKDADIAVYCGGFT